MLNRIELELDLVPVNCHLFQAQRISNIMEFFLLLILRLKHNLIPSNLLITEVVPPNVITDLIVLQVFTDDCRVVFLSLLVNEDDI